MPKISVLKWESDMFGNRHALPIRYSSMPTPMYESQHGRQIGIGNDGNGPLSRQMTVMRPYRVSLGGQRARSERPRSRAAGHHGRDEV